MAKLWTEPDLGKFYLLLDDEGVPLAVCRYIDLVIDLDVNSWPSNATEYDDLMVAYNAWELA